MAALLIITENIKPYITMTQVLYDD